MSVGAALGNRLQRTLLVLGLVALAGGCRWLAGYDAADLVADGAPVDAALPDGLAADGLAADGGPSADIGDASLPALRWHRVFGHRSSAVEVGGVAVDDQDRRYVVGRFEGRLLIEGAVPTAVEAPLGKHALFVYRYGPKASDPAKLWSLAATGGEIHAVRDALVADGSLVVALKAEGSLPPPQLVPQPQLLGAYVLWIDLSALDKNNDLVGAVSARGRVTGMKEPWALAANDRYIFVAAEQQSAGQTGVVEVFPRKPAPSPAVTRVTSIALRSASGVLRLRALAATKDCLFYAASGQTELKSTLDGKDTKVPVASEATVLFYRPIETVGVSKDAGHKVLDDPASWVRPLGLAARQDFQCEARLLRQTNKGLVLQGFSASKLLPSSLSDQPPLQATVEVSGSQQFDRLPILHDQPRSIAQPDTWIGGAFAALHTIKGFTPSLGAGGHTASAALTQRLALLPPSNGEPTPRLLAAGSLPAGETFDKAGPALSSDGMFWGEVAALDLGDVKLAHEAGGTSRFELCCSALDPSDGTLWVGGVLHGAVQLDDTQRTSFAPPRTILVAYDDVGKAARAIELSVTGQVADENAPVVLRALAFDETAQQLVAAVSSNGELVVADLLAGGTIGLDSGVSTVDASRIDVLWVTTTGSKATLAQGVPLRGRLRLAARAGRAALAGQVADPASSKPQPVDDIGVYVIERIGSKLTGQLSFGMEGTSDALADLAFYDDAQLLVASNVDPSIAGAAGPLGSCAAGNSFGGKEEGLLATLQIDATGTVSCKQARWTGGKGDEGYDSIEVYRPEGQPEVGWVALAGRFRGSTALYDATLKQPASGVRGGYLAMLDPVTNTLRWVKQIETDADLTSPLELTIRLRSGTMPDMRLGLVHSAPLSFWGADNLTPPGASQALLVLARVGLSEGSLIWSAGLPLAGGGELRGLEVTARDTIVVARYNRQLTLPDGQAFPAGPRSADMILRFGPTD